ncbi:EGT [Plodia interpunctella granulovirus]|uniref:Ecdysteroid UDP-glucosyltransferase n=1 Tax=Plodia interpunctella granulovirus TaxID=262175 RepID=A0A1L5JH75_9BBAC|nr:EGT [Plodia interpunctella granulovirus]APO14006.1 EGT [Plodia interpunctella granulovirus]
MTSFSLTMLTCVLVLFVAIPAALAANILCVFPTPAYSHQLVFASYVDKLAAAGHNITIITPSSRPVKHVHQIIVPSSGFSRAVSDSKPFKKRGVVADETTVTANNYRSLVRMVVEQFKSANVTALLRNGDNRFDLVVCEAYMTINLMFGAIYNAPVIRFSSGYGTAENIESMSPWVEYDLQFYPSIWRSTFNMDVQMEYLLMHEWNTLERWQEWGIYEICATGVCDGSITKTMKNNVKMMFLNVPAVFDNNRPVPSTIQYLGGIHLKRPSATLDGPLSEFLNGQEVVVYASFGSVTDISLVDGDLLTEFVRVFSALPYRVLWHVDPSIHTRFNVSKNVLTRRWFSQREVLNHPHVRVFVTQGGVQSTDEAIDSGVPLIGLPMMGDQFFNVKRYTDLGIGIGVDVLNLEREQLERKIVQVVNDDQYLDNIHRLREKIHDVPMQPLYKSLWYTNYVLRNKAN